jgi:hypothetical protein
MNRTEVRLKQHGYPHAAAYTEPIHYNADPVINRQFVYSGNCWNVDCMHAEVVVRIAAATEWIMYFSY